MYGLPAQRHNPEYKVTDHKKDTYPSSGRQVPHYEVPENKKDTYASSSPGLSSSSDRHHHLPQPDYEDHSIHEDGSSSIEEAFCIHPITSDVYSVGQSWMEGHSCLAKICKCLLLTNESTTIYCEGGCADLPSSALKPSLECPRPHLVQLQDPCICPYVICNDARISHPPRLLNSLYPTSSPQHMFKTPMAPTIAAAPDLKDLLYPRRHPLLEALKPPLYFLQSNHSISVLENFPVGHVVMVLRTNRESSGSRTRVSGNNNDDEAGLTFQILGGDSDIPFELKNNGELVVKNELDFETKRSYLLSISVSDGRQSDVTSVAIRILNVNDHDPEFSEAYYTFFVSESSLNSSNIVGVVKARDADAGDSVNLSLKGPFANMFSIDKEGFLRIINIKQVNSSQCHLILVASDSGSPPRSSSVAATVHFPASLFASRTTFSPFNRNQQDTDQRFDSSSSNTHEDSTKNIIYTANNDNREDRERSERKHYDVSERNPSKEVDVNALFSTQNSSAVTLITVLGVLLATLLIIIVTLTVHLLKQRKFTVVGTPVTSSSGNSSGSASKTNPYTQQLYTHNNLNTHHSNHRNSQTTNKDGNYSYTNYGATPTILTTMSTASNAGSYLPSQVRVSESHFV